MAVLPIVLHPEAVLKQKAAPVTEFGRELEHLIDDMFDTLYAAPGIGLAAPQIGRSLRLFVYDFKEADDRPRQKGVFINPVFLKQAGIQNDEEGCLSVADFRTWVKRAATVTIEGLGRDGKKATIEAEGLLARLFQHEMDHLDGLLFIDRVSRLKRDLYLNRLKKIRKSRQSD